MATDDKARAEDKPSLDYAEPRIIVQARAELQTCLIVMPSAAENLKEIWWEDWKERKLEPKGQNEADG